MAPRGYTSTFGRCLGENGCDRLGGETRVGATDPAGQPALHPWGVSGARWGYLDHRQGPGVATSARLGLAGGLGLARSDLVSSEVGTTNAAMTMHATGHGVTPEMNWGGKIAFGESKASEKLTRISNLENEAQFMTSQNPESYQSYPVFPSHPIGSLKTAGVAQMQGARGDGMAHAISSLVQRRRWVAHAVFRLKAAGVAQCKAHEATEWHPPFQALCNAADGSHMRFLVQNSPL